MFFSEITVLGFRNLENQTIPFNKRINLVLGENAQGKTNLLESIYILITGKSFREKNDINLINYLKKEAVIRAIVSNGDTRIISPAIKIISPNSQFYIDSKAKKAKGLASYENITAVVFLPEDLELIKGAPVNRRGYLDNIIGAVWVKHKINRINYFKVLKQRNMLLKNNNFSSLSVWNNQLVKYGSRLILKRIELVRPLELVLNKIIKNFVEEERISLRYSSSVLKEADSGESYIPDIAYIEKSFEEALKSTLETDMKFQSTTTGPHKDDLLILLNDKSTREFCSQGQQRTLAIALRIAEWEIYKAETGCDSILLLDDIFSELDENRKKKLLDFIYQKKQSFITSVNIDFIENDINLSEAKIFTVEEGKISVEAR